MADRVTQLMYLVLVVISLFTPGAVAGLPLLAYQPRDWKKNWPLLLSLIPVLNLRISATPYILTLLMSAGAFLLGHWTRRSLELQEQYYSYVDNSSELLRRQRQLNNQLMAQRELDRTSDILTERNRIARSIHDNVGHKLTSSILQVKALELSAEDEDESAKYNALNTTLTEAMEMIRSSIHDIHSDSLSIETALEKLAYDFDFCPVNLTVRISDPPSPTVYYTIMAICREGLNNSARHSNASRADITLKQWGGYYQLLVTDNGYNSTSTPKLGMGLLSMEERATAIGGSMNINQGENGFRIFARLPAQA
ncbi:MAG: histidine kinase [Eubacteriales bacterium]|nr:histidine kinase [Eubacteriales bacterium]